MIIGHFYFGKNRTFLFWLYIEKKVVASKTIKKYDTPKTPYQRVLESPDVAPAIKRSLKEQYSTLNPFRLRKIIERKLKVIFDICYP